VSLRVTETRFEELVDDALDSVPDALFEAMDNVVVLIADRHPDEPDLLGLYEGVALTERDTTYSGFLPDTITIYRGALCAFCSTEEELVHEVAVTVIHEIAHHFGIDEETLHALGWG
jgi:predicted Zn-dependent protease with MMP-like domain